MLTSMRSVQPLRSKLPKVWITYITEEGNWVLAEDYRVQVHWNQKGRWVSQWVTVPGGFIFDLASIPRPVWSLIAPFELSLVAPLIHDYLYRNLGEMSPGKFVSREDTDSIFHELMYLEGVPKWKRKLAYKAVRVFSGIIWKRRMKNEEEPAQG